MAGISITFDTTRFAKEAREDLDKLLAKADALIDANLEDAVTMAVQLAPKNLGGAGLAGSIAKNREGQFNYEFVANQFYASFMEFGTKTKTVIPAGYEDLARGGGAAAAGNAGYGATTLDAAIRQWVKDKGIRPTVNTPAGMESMIYLIKREILLKGVKAQPYFVPAWEKFKAETIRQLQQL
jgi:hypothetical protein